MPSKKEQHRNKARQERGIRFKKDQVEQRGVKKRIIRIKKRFGSKIGLEFYKVFFGIEDKDIIGKHILDAGSATGQFALDVGKNARVVSMDPSYVERGRTRKLRARTKPTLAGVVQRLPFEDKKFDVVFARRVFPDKIKGIDRYESIKEMLRIVKKNGMVGIGPFLNTIASQKTLIKVEKFLNDSRFRFERNTIEVPLKQGKYQKQTYLKIWRTGSIETMEKLVEKV